VLKNGGLTINCHLLVVWSLAPLFQAVTRLFNLPKVLLYNFRSASSGKVIGAHSYIVSLTNITRS